MTSIREDRREIRKRIYSRKKELEDRIADALAPILSEFESDTGIMPVRIHCNWLDTTTHDSGQQVAIGEIEIEYSHQYV